MRLRLAATFSIDASLIKPDVDKKKRLHAIVGSSLTTDAPLREISEAIESARSRGVLAVEMEAAALYTFARAKNINVLCLALVTDSMGREG
jgi:purine-nucleoside phosphorylase